jgi:hypothetical protein
MTKMAGLALVAVLALSACGDSTEILTGASPAETPSPEVTVVETPTETSAPVPADDCTLESEESYQGRALISVFEPCTGEVVSSPVTIAGEANVFEATVSFRVLDENGTEIATGFTTADCGTGCWGNYTGEVKFTVDHEQPGMIEVFESSAKDGSDVNKISIPVTLTP